MWLALWLTASCSAGPIRRPVYWGRNAGRLTAANGGMALSLGELTVRMRTCLLIVGMLASTGATSSASTILENVLYELDRLGSGPLTGVFANIAQNESLLVPRELAAGDQVIVGYASDGSPIIITAGVAGLTVTPDVVSAEAVGLLAGLYPAGSTLYSAGAGGGLSLYGRSSEGLTLAEAAQPLFSRIDGSVTTIISGIDPLLGRPAIVTAGNSSTGFWGGGAGVSLSSTVLGAANTGQVFTNLLVQVTPSNQTSNALAGITIGLNSQVEAAISGNSAAVTSKITQIGSTSVVPVLNMASNNMSIDGHVTLIVRQTSLHIGDILATTLGAVNSGSIEVGGQGQSSR